MYMVIFIYDPKHINPFTGRKGKYRVRCAHKHWENRERPFIRTGGLPSKTPNELWMTLNKPLRRGAFANPTKELKKVLEARTGVK